MDIQEINRDIIAYLGQMLKDNEDYDVRNMNEDDYNNIIQTYLNDFENGYDFITEYYGNTTIFIPSLEGFLAMMDLITTARQEYDDKTDWSMFMNLTNNNYHRYCDVLRHYAYHYITNLGYDGFTEELNEWIQENITDESDYESEGDDNFDYENSCDCCVKSWTNTANEFGFCSCMCSKCGDELRNCRYKCCE